MINWGSVPSGSVLPFMFSSYDGATGASEAISGLAVTDIEIFKGTSMTQRSSDAGVVLLDTDGIDIDTMVGINGFSVDTGDNTDAGFYAVGSFFTVVVASITADAQTVNFVAGTFRLLAAEGTSGTPVADATRWNNLATVALPLIPTTAGRTLDVTAAGNAGIDWANVEAPTTTLGLTNTTVGVVTLVNTLTTYTGNTVQTGDSFARIGVAGAGLTNIDLPNQTMDITGSLSGSVGSVTGAVGSVTGAVGSVTGAVGSVAAGGITAASIATGAIDADAIAADAVTEIQAGLATPTNITAGVITTVTNLTNAPTSGDLTATMKTSIGTAVAASAVASVTANVNADVKKINGTTVNGDGGATPWGP